MDMASTSREAGSARAYLNSGGTKRILLPRATDLLAGEAPMTSGRQWCLSTDDRQARSPHARDHGVCDHAEADSDSVQLLPRRPARRRGHRVLEVLLRPARKP